MRKTQKSIIRIMTIFIILFASACGYIIKLCAFDSKDIISNPYNPRLYVSDESIVRGSIKDANGEILAYTDSGQRIYTYGEEFCHLLGYVDYGRTGVEAYENFQLEKIEDEIVQRLKNIFFKTDIEANNVVLTVDSSLQKKIYSLLGDAKGAVIVMEPSTGRILSMVSSPGYDSNLIESDWNKINADKESPLLNRAAQGTYPPGSTFKIITALCEMRNFADFKDYEYECTGEEIFDGKIIHCYNNKKHGKIKLEEALSQSCNCYFAKIGEMLGSEKIMKTAEELLLNAPLGYSMDYTVGTVDLNKSSSLSELVETSIGQGKTLVTPLYMTMLVSSIANGGIMMKPYAADHYENYKGETTGKKVPEKLSQVMTLEEAKCLKDMLIKTVTEGTAKNAYIPGIDIFGKTGTAENSTGSDHGWFVSVGCDGTKDIAVTVLIEDVTAKNPVSIAKEIYLMYFNIEQ